MAENLFSVPIAFIIFNRPEVTTRTFSEIAKIKPKKLLVIGDGPRKGVPGEDEQVQEVRAIIEGVDWNCEVITNYSEINMGCKRRVSTGLDWVFSQVNEAIILEDDCLPNHSFFMFSQVMLETYRNCPEIGMISGINFQKGAQRGNADYYFSKYMHIWGWATWSDRWRNCYDVDMKGWPEFSKTSKYTALTVSPENSRYWSNIFNRVYRGEIDTWDYQWVFANWLRNRLCIIPNFNLISNIGFGAGATHTIIENPLSNLPVIDMTFPLKHPDCIKMNLEADRFTELNYFSENRLRKTANFLKKIFKI